MSEKKYGGKRGKKGKGYTIKTINGKDYVYVWGAYDKKRTDKKRHEKGTKSHTIVEGWFSMGRSDKDETWLKVEAFLHQKHQQEIKHAEQIIETLENNEVTIDSTAQNGKV